MPIITLTTDFGTRDGYVGAMKGVIASVLQDVLTWGDVWEDTRIIDLAHDIPRGDIAHAAWVVATACNEFPEDTIHVVVVDPGVGGSRRGVVVGVAEMRYVGPDNGVFAYLKPTWVRAIENRRLIAEHVSSTFHGRDVFAPIAAFLAAGGNATEIGAKVELAGRLPWGARPAGEGRVVHVDRFGNLISDLPAAEAGVAVAFASRRLPIVRTYEDVPSGELLAYIGSADTVEIAVRDGRADRLVEEPRGTRVVPIADPGEYR